jgi:hypothetical protein
MGAVLTAALYRSLLVGLLTGVVTALTARQQSINGVNLSWENAIIAGVISACTIILARGLGEGTYDANRAATGNMNAGDVPVASDKVAVEPIP